MSILKKINGTIVREIPVEKNIEVKVNENWINELLSGCKGHIEFYNKYLRGISYLRIMDDYKLLKKYVKPEHKVLEFGALPPLLDLMLCEESGVSDITVLDPNASEFQGFFTKRNIKYVEADILESAKIIERGTYDVIVISAVWEHLLTDVYQLVKVIHSFLKEDGILFFTVPTTSSISGIYGLLCEDSGFATKYREGIVKQFTRFEENGYYGHVREYTIKEIEDLFEYRGRFKVLENTFDKMYTGGVIDALESIYPERGAMAKYVFKKCSEIHTKILDKTVCVWGRGHTYQMNNRELRNYIDIGYVIDSKANDEEWLDRGISCVTPDVLERLSNPYIIIMLEREEYRNQVKSYLESKGIPYSFYDELEIEGFIAKRPEV